MMILFVVLSFVMVFILIWQQIQHKKLVREIDYITSRLDTISVISENGFVLIPTDNDSIKKLSAALNKLLQDFYTKKSQFEQSKQAMAKVLTNISHDIRTPLTVLKGNSEMLSNITNTYAASENVHAMAVKIDQKADDLFSTINDYFTMSKITSGDFSIKMKKKIYQGFAKIQFWTTMTFLNRNNLKSIFRYRIHRFLPIQITRRYNAF